MPNSVRKSAPVGHTSRQPAWVQCLHTSELMSHRKSGMVPVAAAVLAWATAAARSPRGSTLASAAAPSPLGLGLELGAEPIGRTAGIPRSTSFRPDSRAVSMRSLVCSMKATCRHVLAPSDPVLS